MTNDKEKILISIKESIVKCTTHHKFSFNENENDCGKEKELWINKCIELLKEKYPGIEVIYNKNSDSIELTPNTTILEILKKEESENGLEFKTK